METANKKYINFLKISTRLLTVLVKRDITCVVSEKGKDLQETDNNRRQSEESRTVPLSDFRKTTNSKEESVMKLVPLFDRVVLKQLIAEETTKSGIVLPGTGEGETAAG